MPAVQISELLAAARAIATPLMDATSETWSEEITRLGQYYWVPPGEARLRLGASYFSQNRTLDSSRAFVNAEIRVEIAYNGVTAADRRAWVDGPLQILTGGANPTDFAGSLIDAKAWTSNDKIHSLSAVPEAAFPEEFGNVVSTEVVVAVVVYG